MSLEVARLRGPGTEKPLDSRGVWSVRSGSEKLKVVDRLL